MHITIAMAIEKRKMGAYRIRRFNVLLDEMTKMRVVFEPFIVLLTGETSIPVHFK